jgi:sulfur relay (sulfurtransferase) DsrC/TusE family protein
MTTKKREEIIMQPSHIKVYNFVVAYIKKHIVSPEMNEIAKGIKYEERQVHRLVADLCSLGYISKKRYYPRSIKIEKELR